MGKCAFCDTETNDMVDYNMGGKSYLCSKCKSKFEKCEICGEYFLGEELAENGICDSCNGNND
ncbi:MAG: hypothetical protein KH415_16015 [Clostridium sp.]|nr:hypothetical protein [Clostridium sp.]